jgi:hypothetical protein
MHYGEYADSEARRGPSIETIPPGIPIGQRKGLSLGDIDAVQHMYGFPSKYVTVATHVNGLKIIVDGVPYTSPARFEWEPGSSHSLEVAPEQVQDGTSYQFGRWTDEGEPAHTITVSPEVTIYTANFIRNGNTALASGKMLLDGHKRSEESKSGDRQGAGNVDSRREIGADRQDDRARNIHSGNAAAQAH